jgi:hypothetical protein
MKHSLPKHMTLTPLQRGRQSMIARGLIKKAPKPMTALTIGGNNFVYVSTSSGTNTVSLSGPGTWTTSSTTSTIPTWVPSNSVVDRIIDRPVPYTPDHQEWKVGRRMTVTLPDGTMIEMEPSGNFKIIDAKAKITYKSNNVRDFNSYINASDKLEDFIKFCGEVGVRQGEMLEIPIKHFIGWLIVKAAEADGEELPALPDLCPKLPRCMTCGRFMAQRRAERKVFYCRPTCLEKELRK